jgi:hypothetical protein
MKKSLVLLPLVAVLTACGSMSGSNVYEKRAEAVQESQERYVDRAIDKAPNWMTKLPESKGAVYANGTAVSADMGFADVKAKTMAYMKICMAAGGVVNSQTKIFRQDSEKSSTELSEMAVKSMCQNVDITGVETVELKRIAEGNRFRTYALVALPTGNANVLRQERQIEREQKRANQRAPEAFKELDRNGQTGPVSVVTPDGNGTLALMPVDNEEYKQRRAEALQKPGAVIGQTTVR